MLGKVLAGIGVIILLFIIYFSTVYTNAKINEIVDNVKNPYAETWKIFLILFWIFVWLMTILCCVLIMWILTGYIIANGE